MAEDEVAALRTSASQTSASIHSGSNSHVLSLSELNDLALRGPEPGQINYYFLHQVIDTLIKELGLQEHPSLVLESYVSVDDAYLVPQTNSTQFNNAIGSGARRRSNANITENEQQQRRRSSALRLIELHGSKSQTERPGKKSTGEPTLRSGGPGTSNLTSISAIAVTGAKSAPSIAAAQQQPNSLASNNNNNKTGRNDATSAANPPAAAATTLENNQNFPPASPAFTDASGFSASSAAGGSPRRGSPKDKIGVIVSKQHAGKAATPTEDRTATTPTTGGSRKTGNETSSSPLHRALSRSNIPQHVGGTISTGGQNSGQVTPLNRRESGTSTNTTTIKVYNAIPSGKKISLAPGEYSTSRPGTDSGHVRARLDRLERFVQQLLSKGGAASADQIKSILDQIEALGGGPKQRSIDPDEVFERLTDAEQRLRHLAATVVDLSNSSNKFKHFLDDASVDGDDKTQESTAPLHLTKSQIQRKATQAHSDAQLANAKVSHVETKVDDGLAHAQAERRALQAKAEAIAAEISKAKADKVTPEAMDNLIRSHLAGIVSWGELDDALQEMRDSFSRFSLSAMAAAAGGATNEDAVAHATAAAASMGSLKAATAGRIAQAKAAAAAGGKTASSSAAGGGTGGSNNEPKSAGGVDAQKQQKRGTSKKRGETQQAGSDAQQEQLPGKKRYRHISKADNEGDDEQQKLSLAERAARREEINARAAAWSAAKAARSPGLDSSADSSSDIEGSPQSLSPPFGNGRPSQQDPALVRSKENVFRQLEQLSRTGKTLPSVLDDLQVRLDKAATQAQVNSIIDEIASDLALQNQRIEELAERLRLLEEQMLQLDRQNAQQAAALSAAAAAATAPSTAATAVTKLPGTEQAPDGTTAAKAEAQLLSQRLLDAQRERDLAKKTLDQELRRASTELIKKSSKDNAAATDNAADASRLKLSDEWLKLQDARIQNLLDRIDALRAECEGDRTELLSTLNVMGTQLKDLQRNYSKLSKQLQEGSGSGGSGGKYGRRARPGRSNSQNPFAEDELDDIINECQNDIETLKAVVKDLALKDGEFEKAIEAIMELIERLQETKADKSIISTLLSTKADKKALETKISRSTFEMLETKWQGLMESTSDKLEALEKDLRIFKNRRAQDYAAFATRAELLPLQDAINTDMRILKEQLERVIRVLELEEAAAVRKSWMRCIACDRKCDMPDHAQHPSVPYLPPMPLMAAASVEAYTAQHLAAAAALAAQGGVAQHFQHGGAGAAQNVADTRNTSSAAAPMRIGGDTKPLTRYEQLLVRKDITRNLMNHEVAYKNAYNSTQHKRDQHYSQERPVGGFHTLVAAAPKSPKQPVNSSRSSEQHRALEQ